MTNQKEATDVGAELLPPGDYLIWTPYNCYEATALLMQTFDDHLETMP